MVWHLFERFLGTDGLTPKESLLKDTNIDYLVTTNFHWTFLIFFKSISSLEIQFSLVFFFWSCICQLRSCFYFLTQFLYSKTLVFVKIRSLKVFLQQRLNSFHGCLSRWITENMLGLAVGFSLFISVTLLSCNWQDLSQEWNNIPWLWELQLFWLSTNSEKTSPATDTWERTAFLLVSTGITHSLLTKNLWRETSQWWIESSLRRKGNIFVTIKELKKLVRDCLLITQPSTKELKKRKRKKQSSSTLVYLLTKCHLSLILSKKKTRRESRQEKPCKLSHSGHWTSLIKKERCLKSEISKDSRTDIYSIKTEI